MYKRLISLFFLLFFSSLIIADNGLVNVKSLNSVKITSDRLEQVLKAKGMTVFNRINHSQGAKKVGKKLPPTELIIFGNPKVGTLLMQCQQTTGIDLPLKALIWKDEKGSVWLTYNHPNYLIKRHQIDECVRVSEKITAALKKFVAVAVNTNPL